MPEIPSLLPAPGASSATLICPERLQPVPGTLPTGWFPKQAHPSVPNANLLIQLLAPLHFFIYLSFSRAPLPSLLRVSKFLPSPEIILSALHQRSSFLLHLPALANICHLSTPVPVLQGCASLLPCRVTDFFLLPMLCCDLYPPKYKQPANPSQSRLQPQNKCTRWNTTQHGKMDCKCFRKQQKPKRWGGGELVLHLLSCTKACILTPYLWCRQQEGATPHRIHLPLAT